MSKKLLEKVGYSGSDPVEERFLGSLMASREAVHDVMESHVVPEGAFTGGTAKKVFAAMMSLVSEGSDVTVLNVHRKSGVPERELRGMVDLHNQSGEKPSGYAALIIDRHIRRESANIAQEVINAAMDDSKSPEESIMSIVRGFELLFDTGGSVKYEKTINDATRELMANLERMVAAKREGRQEVFGMATGLRDIDNHTGGFRDGDLIVVAGRPGSGKTAYALTMAFNAAMRGEPVGIITAEMSAVQLAKRVLSMHSAIDGNKIRDAEFEDFEYTLLGESARLVGELPMYFNEKGGIHIAEIERTARKWKRQHGIKMLLIDYAQLVKVDAKGNKNRTAEVEEVSRFTKSLAKNLDMPVVALSQLSRAVETRGGSKRPQMSDLRQSGAIEEDADMIMLMFRPEYYGLIEDEEGNDVAGMVEINIAKFRDGTPEVIKVGFRKETTLFHDWNPHAAKPGFFPPEPPPRADIVTRPNRNDDEDIPF